MIEKRILFFRYANALPGDIATALSLAGFEVLAVESETMASAALHNQRFDLLIICEDAQHQPDAPILRIVENVRKGNASIPVIVLSNDDSGRSTTDEHGLVMYLPVTVSAEDLLDCIDQLIDGRAPRRSNFVAADANSKELLYLARRVAATDVAVLISGESGTGKEMLARYIHKSSCRSNGPFTAINCAAIPENMLEAVLFGYEKGAFTGALRANPGKFEQSQGGTLLLDEISEMDVTLQAKLLRVLQEHEVERLGSQQTVKLDIRVLATTNRLLKERVKSGHFREDLYYRINVFPLRIPPLRERKNDIAPLLSRLIERHCPSSRQQPAITDEAIEALTNYEWPGNVRELENIVQRALVLCDDLIKVEHLHFEESSEGVQRHVQATLGGDLMAREFDLILRALSDGDGSRKKAAESLGISARTLRYKLAKMRNSGIDIPGDVNVAGV